MKKIISVICLIVFAVSLMSQPMILAQESSEEYVKLYAEGKSKLFKKSEVAAQLTVGWYLEPVQRLYAEGKSKLFKQSEVAAQLTVGWYTEPVQRLYAVTPYERSKLFKESEVEAQLTVGWYTEPVEILYATYPVRKSKVFKKSEVEAQLTVGWKKGPDKGISSVDYMSMTFDQLIGMYGNNYTYSGYQGGWEIIWDNERYWFHIPHDYVNYDRPRNYNAKVSSVAFGKNEYITDTIKANMTLREMEQILGRKLNVTYSCYAECLDEYELAHCNHQRLSTEFKYNGYSIVVYFDENLVAYGGRIYDH